jgi:hypothetical protein
VKRSAPLLLGVALLAGCSGSSSPTVTIGAAKTYRLVDTEPARAVRPGMRTVGFTVDQPSGRALTAYRTGAGPHTGVHVIVVKDDLSAIVHRHPPIPASGRIKEPIDFASPGPYRVLADVYPKLSGPLRNFQLHYPVRVSGAYKPQPLPPFRAIQSVDGYRVVVHGKPKLRAFYPAFVRVTVRDPQGKPVTFTPWYGALAHAIFFHRGDLAYFHTHVCGPNTPGCTSIVGNPNVKGTSSAPGQLRLGILLPQAGTWRMFLQFQAHDKVLTVPFTLKAS